jgi:hypothetical protein
MRWSTALVLVVLSATSLGCGEREEGSVPEAAPMALPDTSASNDTLLMPEFPEPRRGQIVASGAGAYELDATWTGRAAACEDPPVMEILGERPGIGVLVLLQLPGDNRATSYPVTIVEQGAPEPPASQIAVQALEGTGGRAFQGWEGTVEISGLDSRVSGRFAVTLRETSTNDLQKYAGVFQGILIEPLPEEQCRQIKEALTALDSTAADSAQ